MNNIKQIKLESLEADLEKLAKDYTDVDEKRRRESNPQERNNLELLLKDIEKNMKKVEQQLNEQKQQDKEAEIQTLLTILQKQEISKYLKKAYQTCCPEDWQRLPEDSQKKPEEVLKDLSIMPSGSSNYTKIEQFVACLVVNLELPLSVHNRLNDWANQNINNFQELLNQTKLLLAQRQKIRDSYLLVVLKRSNQKSSISQNADSYAVNAWIIDDVQAYSYQSGTGCENLISVNSDDELSDRTFTINEIPQLLNKFIEKSSEKYSFNNLIIELFLPLDLLNHDVDRWVLDEYFDFSTPIGHEYRVVVRSYERLTTQYRRRRAFWENKWEVLQQFTQSSAYNAFLLGDEDNLNSLIGELQSSEIIGLKLAKAPVKLGKGSILAAILQTAIPVALWLRKNISGLDCQSEIDQILHCCIHHLPESVKKKRLCATSDTDNHIGHHLSLLWEDPYRLPPTIDYSME